MAMQRLVHSHAAQPYIQSVGSVSTNNVVWVCKEAIVRRGCVGIYLVVCLVCLELSDSVDKQDRKVRTLDGL